MEEVARSIRVGSTLSENRFMLGGFVAGEASFVASKPPSARFADGTQKKQFVFQVSVASRDRALLQNLQSVVGFGGINDFAARRPHWEPMSVFSIRARQAHRLGTIPFVDRHLVRSAKRSQYELWREEFLEYDRFVRHRATTRRASSSIETPASRPSVARHESTTTAQRARDIAAFLGGFAAAEGCFVHSGEPPVFRFSIGLGASDRSTCELFRRFLGSGRIRWYPRRKPHYDDEVVFVIASLRDHLAVTIPFMDQHLPASFKRDQYLVWRSQLLEYWEHRAKRPRPCTIDGCEERRRAHGLCRHHLWQLRRQ